MHTPLFLPHLLALLLLSAWQHSLDEVIAAEAYLELFLRRLTEPALIGLFLRFVVASNYDNCSVLSTLIGRIKSSEAVIMKYFDIFVLNSMVCFAVLIFIHVPDLR